MANIIIAKNQTAGNILIDDLGLNVPALSQVIITDYVTYLEAAVSQDLEVEISAGNIILNDGVSDLSLARSLNYLDSSGSFNGPDTVAPNNSLLRFDGTTGKFSKATGITIDNADNLNLNAGSITNITNVSSTTINTTTIDVGGTPLSIDDLDDVDTVTQTPTTNDSLSWDGVNWSTQKNNATTVDPTGTDDSSVNYDVGSRWINTADGREFVCLDATVSAAIWTETTAYGSITLHSASTARSYATIDAALLASVSGDVVLLGPGSYAESIVVPAGVTIKGLSKDASVISGSLATGTRIVLSDGSKIDSLKVSLPTDATPAISYSGGGRAFVSGCKFLGSGASGIGLSMSGLGVLSSKDLLYDSGICDALIEQTSGFVEAADLYILGGTLSDIVRVLGGVFEFVNIQASNSATITNGINCGAGEITGSIGTIRGTNALHIVSNAAAIKLRDLTLQGTSYDLLVDAGLTSGLCDLINIRAREASFSRPSAYLSGADFRYSIFDDTAGDSSTKFNSEVHIGVSEGGSELIAGRGDSTTREMVVFSTDSTASNTLDGGTFIDVSIAASSSAASTLSFQGSAANHTLLFCQNLLDSKTSVKLKHWGLKVLQTTASSLDGVYIFENWNGSSWVKFGVMASESREFYRYSNHVFMRASSSEHIRFGLTPDSIWAEKTINGVTGFWSRIRIVTAPTTLPVFEQFKLSVPRWEANESGVTTAHGVAMWRSSLTYTGNVFGESGGISASGILVGTGGLPTGWNHRMKNNQLNGNGDSIYMQFRLPRGICTAFPLRLEIVYGILGTGTNAPEMIASFKPIDVSGVLVANGSSKIPVSRAEVNTVDMISQVGQSDTFLLPEVTESKLHMVTRDGFLIDNYYEGDNVALRIELNNQGADFLDVVIWEVEVVGVKWTPGERM